MNRNFASGADLWIVPDIENSSWEMSLEWPLNFQLSKSRAHKRTSHSLEAKKNFEEFEALDFLSTPPQDSPWTLISVENLLPAKWLVYSTGSAQEDFGEALDQLWKGLGSPTTRFFQPKTWTSQTLKGLKSECLKSSECEVVSTKEA